MISKKLFTNEIKFTSTWKVKSEYAEKSKLPHSVEGFFYLLELQHGASLIQNVTLIQILRLQGFSDTVTSEMQWLL